MAWLRSIVWPEGGPARSDARPRRFWASPSAAAPNILIPVGSRAAARRAVKRYHDGLSVGQRLRSLAAESLMALGSTPVWSLRGRRLDLPGPVDGDLISAIGELLGVDRPYVAIGLSRPKSNRKPVLQVLDGDGRCHGWAKVAWNEPTEAMVANEARWLERIPRPPLIMPRLLHDVELAGRRVVVAGPAVPTRHPRRGPRRPPPAALFRAVAELAPVAVQPVTETSWWRSVDAVLDHATTDERRAVDIVLDTTSDSTIEVGAWHGDLTPWNLMTRPGGVQLIDWEFAAEGVPIGFDLCHFHTQVAAEIVGLDAEDALTYSARLSPHGLAELGVRSEQRRAVWLLYQLELIRRTLWLRAHGYPTDQVRFGAAATGRLARRSTTGARPAVAVPDRRSA